MTVHESHLALAERHVREFEKAVARQEAIVARLRKAGLEKDIVTAESLLATFQATLYAAREHLRIERAKAP